MTRQSQHGYDDPAPDPAVESVTLTGAPTLEFVALLVLTLVLVTLLGVVLVP
jgi:hypothetical protein